MKQNVKQNIKLFFTSLISNNACIDAGRKKPWYAAIIIFFVSIILSVIPTTVLELQKQGDKNFSSTTFMTREATALFAKDLQDEPANNFVVIKQEKESFLQSTEFDKCYYFDLADGQKLGYAFSYVDSNTKVDYKVEQFKEANVSFFIFTPDTVYISVLDPSNPSLAKRIINLQCIKAYKKVGENQLKESYVAGSNKTETANETWANWKVLIKNFYNQTRLRAAGLQLGIMSAINVGIIAIMGFMVWVLTRGKNNPYRMFNVWECYKIVFWAALTPGILTSGLGFLIKSFASTIFPLLLGVRVMWLSMKSLRPDGSGYAAN